MTKGRDRSGGIRAGKIFRKFDSDNRFSVDDNRCGCLDRQSLRVASGPAAGGDWPTGSDPAGARRAVARSGAPHYGWCLSTGR
jgi:hypothetical protein